MLFGIVDKLKRQGVAIAYITHKLEELTRIGDDAVVMRDGQLVGAGPLVDLSRDEIVRMMIGRETKERADRQSNATEHEVLRVEGLSLLHPDRAGDFLVEDVSLTAREGEVVGIFGLMGAGRTELLEALFGLHPDQSSGTIFVDGEAVTIAAPVDAIRLGLALAPEDRKREGLVLGMTVAENTSLGCLPRFENRGIIEQAAEREMVNEAVARFRVKTPSIDQLVRNLSGGNQQKVILGKWLATEPRVLLLDEPTRGIDVQAKEEIYSHISDLSAGGLAVIVVSSELPEILAISDRLIVMCEGRKTAEFSRDEATEEGVMQAALPSEEETRRSA